MVALRARRRCCGEKPATTPRQNKASQTQDRCEAQAHAKENGTQPLATGSRQPEGIRFLKSITHHASPTRAVILRGCEPRLKAEIQLSGPSTEMRADVFFALIPPTCVRPHKHRFQPGSVFRHHRAPLRKSGRESHRPGPRSRTCWRMARHFRRSPQRVLMTARLSLSRLCFASERYANRSVETPNEFRKIAPSM